MLDRIQEKLSELGFESYVVEDRVSESALIRIQELRDRIERGELDAPEDMIRASQMTVEELKKAVRKHRKVPLKLITALAAMVAFVSVTGLVFDQLTQPDETDDWASSSMSMAIEGGGFGRGGGTTLEIGLDGAGGGGDWDEEEDMEELGAGGGGGGSGALGMKQNKGGKGGRTMRLDVGAGSGKRAKQKKSTAMTIILCVASGVLGLMLALLLGQYMVSMKPMQRKRAIMVALVVGGVVMVSGGVALALARSAANEKVETLRKKILAERKKLEDKALAEHQALLKKAASKSARSERKKKAARAKKPVKTLGPFASFMQSLPEVQEEDPRAPNFDRELLPFSAMMDKMRQQRRMMVKEMGDLEEPGAGEGEAINLAVDTVAEGAGKDSADKPADGEGPGGGDESVAAETGDAGSEPAVTIAGDAGTPAMAGADEVDAGAAPANGGEPTGKVAGGAMPGKLAGGKGGATPPKKPKMPKLAQKGLKGKIKGKEVIRLKASGGGGKGLEDKEPEPPKKPEFKLPPMPEIRRPPTRSGPVAMAAMSFSGGFLSGLLLFLIALRRAPTDENNQTEVLS